MTGPKIAVLLLLAVTGGARKSSSKICFGNGKSSCLAWTIDPCLDMLDFGLVDGSLDPSPPPFWTTGTFRLQAFYSTPDSFIRCGPVLPAHANVLVSMMKAALAHEDLKGHSWATLLPLLQQPGGQLCLTISDVPSDPASTVLRLKAVVNSSQHAFQELQPHGIVFNPSGAIDTLKVIDDCAAVAGAGSPVSCGSQRLCGWCADEAGPGEAGSPDSEPRGRCVVGDDDGPLCEPGCPSTRWLNQPSGPVAPADSPVVPSAPVVPLSPPSPSPSPPPERVSGIGLPLAMSVLATMLLLALGLGYWACQRERSSPGLRYIQTGDDSYDDEDEDEGDEDVEGQLPKESLSAMRGCLRPGERMVWASPSRLRNTLVRPVTAASAISLALAMSLALTNNQNRTAAGVPQGMGLAATLALAAWWVQLLVLHHAVVLARGSGSALTTWGICISTTPFWRFGATEVHHVAYHELTGRLDHETHCTASESILLGYYPSTITEGQRDHIAEAALRYICDGETAVGILRAQISRMEGQALSQGSVMETMSLEDFAEPSFAMESHEEDELDLPTYKTSVPVEVALENRRRADMYRT